MHRLRQLLWITGCMLIAACGGGDDRSSAVPEPSNTLPPPVASPDANRAPIALNDNVAFNGQRVSVAVLDNDSDPDGDGLSILLFGLPAFGSVVLDDNGTPSFPGDDRLVYTPSPGFVGSDSFSYTISDSKNGRANGFVLLTSGGAPGLNPQNNSPVATSDLVVVNAPNPVVVDVLANDLDADGDTLSLFSFSSAASGAVSVNDGGTPADSSDDQLIYQPASGFIGNDSLAYSVSDGKDVSTGVVSIVVTAASAPGAVNSEQVCGVVTLGAVANAEISLYRTSNLGFAEGVAIAMARTDANGQWCAAVPATRGVLLVQSRGGAFLDPADSRYADGDARLLRLQDNFLLETVLPENSTFAALTVYSNAVLRKARRETLGHNFHDTLTANRAQAAAAFGFDVFDTPVADVVSPDQSAPEESRQYAMAVGGAALSLNQLAIDLSVAAPNYLLIDALVRDLSECQLDGADAAGAVRVLIAGVPREISNTINLNSQIVRFRNNLAAAYADTAIVKINVPVCAQRVQAADTTPPVFTSVPNNLSLLIPLGRTLTTSDPLVQRFLTAIGGRDDRDGLVPVTARLSDGSILLTNSAIELPLGITTVEFTAQDAAGNEARPLLRVIDVGFSGPPQVFPDRVVTAEDVGLAIAVLENDAALDSPIDATSLQIETPPRFGRLVVDGSSGLVTYSPEPNYFGVDDFSYSVADSAGKRSLPIRVEVVVDPVNDAPLALPDFAQTAQNANTVINVLRNDSDIEARLDPSSLMIDAVPSSGVAAVDFVTNMIVYTPNAGFSGVDRFSYRVSDLDGASSQAITVEVIVNSPLVTPNQAPAVANDLQDGFEDQLVVIDVLSNDQDADGTIDSATVQITQTPSSGVVVGISSTGQITYQPNPNFFGTDQFSYRVADDLGLSSVPAIVYLNIAPSADAPIAQSDVVTGAEDVVTVANLLDNDSDADGLGAVMVTLLDAPSFGSAVWNRDTQQLEYTPVAGFDGSDSLTYQITDDSGLVSQPARVTINVTGVNDAPIAVADVFSGLNNASIDLPLLDNDSDIDNPLVADNVVILTQPINGNVMLVAGQWFYTAPANFVGTVSFDYQLVDRQGAVSNVVTVAITAINSNVSPVALDDAATTTEDRAVVVSVLGNDSDPDGAINSSSVRLVTSPVNGMAVVDSVTGVITYTPLANYFGGDSFTYQVADTDGLLSNVATANVLIAAQADAPVSSNDTATVDENNSIEINVLLNDNDVDGDLDPTSIVILTQPMHGMTFVDGSSGLPVYSPNQDYNGSDSFRYQVSDLSGLPTAAATVSVSVIAQPSPPVTIHAQSTTDNATPIVIAVLSTASDPEDDIDVGSVSVLSMPSNGSAIANADGTITYTPNVTFVGADSFTFQVMDATGLLSNISTISIEVMQSNQPPVADNDLATVLEDDAVTVNVLANDTDPEAALDVSSVQLIAGASNGVAIVNAAIGTITYTPNADYFGSDSFSYQVADAVGLLSNIASVAVTVTNAPDAPEAANDLVTLDENSSIEIDVLANDTDIDGDLDPSTIAYLTTPTQGVVMPDVLSGLPVYKPDSDADGADSFTYEVFDLSGLASNVATVSVTIVPQPSAPVTINSMHTTDSATPVNIAVLVGASDPESDIDASSVTVVASPTSGSAIPLLNGSVMYTPTSTFVGLDSFTFRVFDATGLTSNVSTVSIDVTPVNQPPVATDNTSILIYSGASAVVDVAALSSDADGALDLTSVEAFNELNGTLSVDAISGQVTLTPDTAFTGIASFSYRIADDQGAMSNTADIEITVWPAEDPDLDGVANQFEAALGSNPNAADSSYVFVNHAATATPRDGSDWEHAFLNLQEASSAGALANTSGGVRYVLIADNQAATISGREMIMDLSVNCNDLAFIGSLQPYVVTPDFTGTFGTFGRPTTTLQATLEGDRVIRAEGCQNLHFYALRVRNGRGVDYGGGFYLTNSTVEMGQVVIAGNTALRAGAGIFADTTGGNSSLTIERSRLQSNRIEPVESLPTNGAGLYANSIDSFSISETVVRHNVLNVLMPGATTTGSGGAGLYVENTPTFITASGVSANRSQANGGGVMLVGAATNRVEHSTISGNEALSGGGICLRNTTANTVIHNNLITSNYATTGGGVHLDGAVGSMFSNNTAVFNLVTNDGGGMRVNENSTPILRYNIAQFNFSNIDSGANIGGPFLTLLGLDAQYNFIGGTLASFVGVGNTSTPIAFDQGYYQQPVSEGVNYGVELSNSPLFALNDRYTDATGAQLDSGLLDAGYHYPEGALTGDLTVAISRPNSVAASENNVRIRITPSRDGQPMGPGHRLYVSTTTPGTSVHLYESTNQSLDPLATGNSTQLIDRGNGAYEFLLDTGAVEPTLELLVDDLGASGIPFTISF